MPTVGKKKFPYTDAGMKKAKAAAKTMKTKVVKKKVKKGYQSVTNVVQPFGIVPSACGSDSCTRRAKTIN